MNRKDSRAMKRAYEAYKRNYDKLKAKGYLMEKKMSLYGKYEFKQVWENARDMGIKNIGAAVAQDATLLKKLSQKQLQNIAQQSGEFDYLFKKDGSINKAAFKREFMKGNFVAALIDLGLLRDGREFESAYYG